MAATKQILGPNGEPLPPAVRGRMSYQGTLDGPVHSRQVTHKEAVALVARGDALAPEQVLEIAKAHARGEIFGPDDYERVAKRVRAQGVSFSAIRDRERGAPKPTPITHDTLRLVANRSEWIAAIVKTRKNQIGKETWSIVPKDEDDKSASTKKACEGMEKLLSRPSAYGSQPSSRSWRQFIGEVLNDLLVLDAGAIEKERAGNGDLAALYPVDGATIRPNINDRGGYYPDAYVQLVDGVVTARFGMEDLLYMVDNPQTDVRFAGYGLSPLENLLVSVTADLYAAKYNQSYFEKGSIPEGMINLGEDAGVEDVDEFRLYWMNEIMGRPHALPILGGKGVEWIQWRENNRDMQFMEYQAWLLKKMCAVYQIAPQEIGELEDVNRSTANDQDDVNDSKSIEPIQTLTKDYFDFEIIGPYGAGLGDWIEFTWDEDGDSAEEINAKYQPIVETGGAKRSEWREALGLDAAQEGDVGAEGLEMFLSSGDLKPLPTKEDAELLSVKNQQQREDDQTAQQQDAGGGPASGMPWKPGTGDDPATRQAMRDHDDEHGIGARNTPGGPPDDPVKKTAPDGHDRAPAVTDRQNALIGVFTDHQPRLFRGLSEILGVPLDDHDDDRQPTPTRR